MSVIKELAGIELPLILASGSPRRKKLLSDLGLEFEVMPADVDERMGDGIAPEDYVMRLSERKAEAVAHRTEKEAIIIAADTIVSLDGKILNKPADKNDAFSILKELSGRKHKVYTGICLMNSRSKMMGSAAISTKVFFRDLEDKEMIAYIATGSPMDKAGAYGIQDDMGALFVSRIEGDYYNIVGLPLHSLYTMLKQFGRDMKEA